MLTTSPTRAARGGSRTTLTWGLACAGLTAVVALPALAAAVGQWGSDYLPTQDVAVVDLRVRDVFTSDVPLVGVYSQFGWNHPGPLLFWVLAPLARLLGGEGWSLLVAAALLQVAAIVVTAALAWRWGGPRLTIGALVVLAASYGANGPWVVLEAWNPHVALPFFALFVLSAWRASAGPGPALPIAVGVGSFLVQAHIGYGPLVVGALVWTGARILRPGRAARADARAWRRSLLTATAIGLLCWIGPVLDVVLHPPGNVAALVDWFRPGGATTETGGIDHALRLISASFQLPPPWLHGADDTDWLSGGSNGAHLLWLILPIALVVLGTQLRPRVGPAHRHLLELSWVLLGVSAASLVAVQVPSPPYLFFWRMPIAALLVVSTSCALLEVARGRVPHLDATAGTVGALFVLAACLPLAAGVATAEPPVQRLEPAVRDLLAQIDTTRLDERTVVVDFAGTALGGAQGALVNALDRAGHPVRVDEQFGFQFGEGRAVAREQAEEVWIVVEDGVLLDELAQLPGAVAIATTTPLDPDDEAELVELQRRVGAQLIAAGRPDLLDSIGSPLVAFAANGVTGIEASDLDRLAALNEQVATTGSCRCGIVAFAPAAVPPGVVGEIDPARPLRGSE